MSGTTAISNSGETLFDVRLEASFDFQSREYVALFARWAATAFQHPVWLTHFYGLLAREAGVTPLIIVVRWRRGGKLAMVLPLVNRRYGPLRVVEFADLSVSDYVSPVAAPDVFLQIVTDTAAASAIREQIAPYDLLRIGKLAENSLPLEQLFGEGTRRRMSASSYATRLDGSFGTWREKHLSTAARKKLQKKARQLNRKGEVRFAVVDTAHAIQSVFDAVRLFRSRRFGMVNTGSDLLRLPSYFAFYSAVAIDGRAAFARTYAIWLDSQPIAGAFGIAHRGAFLVLLVGFDEERHGKQSIGSLLFEHIARDCFERGDEALDFTIGDEPFKRRFGAEASPMWSFCQAGSPLGHGAKFIAETFPVGMALARRLWRPR